ncbi:MAG: ATP-binding cassette domain-containing protein [Spirochaetia bacterium]
MINLDAVSFRYKENKNLFDELDLNLKPGTIYGLLGRNGAGKTTLLKLMCGLLFPHSGRIDCMGYFPESRNPAMLEKLYFLPEEFFTPSATADQYRSMFAPLYPQFSGEDFSRNLGVFEIDSGEKMSEMSFGQKKKVLLAFALAVNTPFLLLDEPTNALDIPSKGQFRRLLAGVSREDKVILVSTHQVRDMENLIDPVVILEKGKILFNESMSDVTGKLTMEVSPDEPEGAIYSEKTMGGYASIRERSGKQESKIDLELLFNGITAQPGQFSRLFAKEQIS